MAGVTKPMHLVHSATATGLKVKCHQDSLVCNVLMFPLRSGVWCPDWAPWGHTTLTNDIALLELLHPAPAYNPNIAPIKVARQSPPPGTTAWVGGWGLDGFHPTRTLNLAPMAVQK